MKIRMPVRHECGLTFIELMVTLGILGIMTAIAFPYVVTQKNNFKTAALRTDMQQDVRAAMDLMTREIRMAGFDPSRNGFDGVLYKADTLIVRADINADGDLNDDNEVIKYLFNANQHSIMRTTSAGEETLIENVQSFAFTYKDSAGAAITSAARQADIRQVDVSISGRTARPDKVYKGNGGYRTYTLRSLVVPINLAL